MDIRIIHYFISVYEERSFTKAAERMHVVQPALSMQIRNLEDELGTALFDRNPRGVEPTIAGRRFYELCVPIARNIATAKQEILELVQGDRVTGSLRIGLPSSVCHGILGSVLAEFCILYPHIDISVTEAYSRNVTEQVQAGMLDVGLGAMPLERTSLACRPGFIDQYVLVSGHPINGETLTPCDLFLMKDLKLVIPSERHLLGSTMLDYIANGRIVPKHVMKIDGMVATLESVRNSDWGAVCLANTIIDQLTSKQMYLYPIIKPRMQFELYLLHDLRHPLTLTARSFIEILEKKLREAQMLWSEAISS